MPPPRPFSPASVILAAMLFAGPDTALAARALAAVADALEEGQPWPVYAHGAEEEGCCALSRAQTCASGSIQALQ